MQCNLFRPRCLFSSRFCLFLVSLSSCSLATVMAGNLSKFSWIWIWIPSGRKLKKVTLLFFRHMSGNENEDLLRAMKFAKAKKRKALWKDNPMFHWYFGYFHLWIFWLDSDIVTWGNLPPLLTKWARKRSGMAFEAGYIALLLSLLIWNLAR